MNFSKLIFILSLLSVQFAKAQDITVVISADRFDKFTDQLLLANSDGWIFRPGNDSDWAQPNIDTTTKKSDNHVVITVSDNGNGIPEKEKDKIFQPFFTTKPGTGLGLSYDIIKANRGEIKVESKEEEGTEFIIQLPVV